jgi:hypothetical protein
MATNRKPVTKSDKVNKSAWIRALPHSMPAKDVVEKARAEGIKLSIAQVYTTRSTAKKLDTSPARGRGRPASGGGMANEELAFRRLVLAIGLPKAQAYLSELRRSVGLSG